MTAEFVYRQSNGEVTQAYYTALGERGAAGVLGVNLLRAVKCSGRAKEYSRRYKGEAYERKNWSMGNVCAVLMEHGEALGIVWGWKLDPAQEYHQWVLYVELPTGQVSFHSAERLQGPDYAGAWDGRHASPDRICEFCDLAMATPVGAALICAPAPRPAVSASCLRFGDPESIALARRRR